MLPLVAKLLPFVGPILERVIPNKAKAEEAKLLLQTELAKNEADILKSLAELDKGQIELNKLDAQSDSRFKSMWRPALAWVCVTSFAWHTFLLPFIVFVAEFRGYILPDIPTFDPSLLSTVLVGILGLGAFRTYEKKQGITK